MAEDQNIEENPIETTVSEENMDDELIVENDKGEEQLSEEEQLSGEEFPEKDDMIEKIRSDIEEQKNSVTKISSEVREMHKLYHNEFAGRLKNMQEELEKYHDIDRGRVFDDLLREVARIYCDNEALLDSDAEETVKKRIKYLFMDIEQLLESNGVMKQKSCIGDKRNNKFCQIVERIETDDPDKHDTVACSKASGFYTEKRPLIKELVDIYIYNSNGGEITNENMEGRQ